ncbi:hypothetical protein C5E45_33020 [Nocardia nova]|uniref:Uncharacterized protein n=1 Tax=Nocardia nova TaxID=37330 RepID=A0A2S6ACL0_9NOCA|nr:hypothetical protein C5E41_30760 [Nocardia nova]PPJ31816.1 hypothetical protein C5E45_33020 [Nocardia nova]
MPAPAAGGACADPGATDTAGEPAGATTPPPDPADTGPGSAGLDDGPAVDEVVEGTDTPGLCGADVPC